MHIDIWQSEDQEPYYMTFRSHTPLEDPFPYKKRLDYNDEFHANVEVVFISRDTLLIFTYLVKS